MELHPDVQELADLLAQIEALLRTHDAPFWAEQIALCRSSVEASDAYGLTRFLAMFGGMGSLNDLVLQPGGVPLTTENDQLHALLEKAWNLASALKRELK